MLYHFYVYWGILSWVSFIRYHADWLAGKNFSEMAYFCIEWDSLLNLISQSHSLVACTLVAFVCAWNLFV